MNKKTLSPKVIVAVLVILPFGCVQQESFPPEKHETCSSTFAQRLRGVNLKTPKSGEAAERFRATTMPELERWNVNIVRILLYPFESAQADLEKKSLTERLQAYYHERWPKIVDWCLGRNIEVVVAVCLDTSWPELRSWPEDGRSFWKDAEVQEELIQAWRTLAGAFRGKPGLLFDLVNEPHGRTPDEIQSNHKLPKQVWNELYPRIVAAVQQVDRQRGIVVEPIWGIGRNLRDLRVVNDKCIIYSIHFYTPHSFTHQGGTRRGFPEAGTVSYPGTYRADRYAKQEQRWDKAALAEQLQPAVEFQKQFGSRLLVGEFGCSWLAPSTDRVRWIRDALELFEERGFDWIFWGYGYGKPVPGWGGWGAEYTDAEPVLREYLGRNRQKGGSL